MLSVEKLFEPDRVGTCAVCGEHGPLYVRSSLLGGITNGYCMKCLTSGAEPWGDLVAYISCAGRYPDDINWVYRKIVRVTCKRLGKTEEEFAAAVDKEIESESVFFG